MMMHTLTIQVAYTFGDRVVFDSKTQRRNGKGRIVFVTVDEFAAVTYTLDLDDAELGLVYQAGILESEIVRLIPA